MSCPPEYRYAIYVDGELEGEALREVQEHLVGCRRCRALVVALEEEATLLGDLLHDRPAAWRGAVPPRRRARGLAVGLAPALGVAALVATVGAWLLERALPAGADWLNPLVFMGATEMIFDTVFVLRDRAPGLFDLAVAAGAMAAFAALATFLLGALTRRLGGDLGPLMIGLGAAVCVGAAGPAHALELRHQEGDVLIAEDETVTETLVLSGDRVTVDGTVDGDLVVLSERFVLNGDVEGNLFAAAREVELRGKVGGSAHVGGERVDVEGAIARSLYGGAETLTLHGDGSVGADALLAGDLVRLEGRAGRNVTAFGEHVEIRGRVGRHASTHSKSLLVHGDARIEGDLDLHLPEGEEARIEDEASVGGEIRRAPLEEDEEASPWTDPHAWLVGLVFLASAFLVGMGLHRVAPRVFAVHVETATEFFRCLGLGVLGLVATPLVLVLCLVTVVGIPIGVIGFFVYATALFLSIVVVAALVGSAVLGRETESAYAFGTSLLLGLVIVLGVANLPFVGGLVKILVLLTGLGLLISSAYEAWPARPARPA